VLIACVVGVDACGEGRAVVCKRGLEVDLFAEFEGAAGKGVEGWRGLGLSGDGAEGFGSWGCLGGGCAWVLSCGAGCGWRVVQGRGVSGFGGLGSVRSFRGEWRVRPEVSSSGSGGAGNGGRCAG
jgi:hypothetical protein